MLYYYNTRIIENKVLRVYMLKSIQQEMSALWGGKGVSEKVCMFVRSCSEDR